MAVALALAVGATPAVANGGERSSLLDFELRSLDAPESHGLHRHGGKPVVLLFFEPDCNWCLRQFLAVNDLAKRCGDSFRPLAIGVNGDRGRLRRELRRVQPRFPAYQASPELIAALGGIPATPVLLVGDAEGRLLNRLRGYVAPERLADELRSAGAAECAVAERSSASAPR